MPVSSSKDSQSPAVATGLKAFGGLVLETIKVVLISMAIILPIRYFLVQPFYVEGASMEPTFSSNQYLLVDELSYRFEAPQRGEVVVFRYPRDPRQFYIKRVIGLPGETISIKKGTIYVNDQAIRENYLDEFRIVDTTTDPITLAAGQYWLMGDNRANSLDSRIFGPVDKKFIIGKVWFRGWPADKFSFFQAPQY